VDLTTGQYTTILADPPWLFENRTGKVAPKHKRLFRYHTMSNDEIIALPVSTVATPKAHLYLWVPNALVELGLKVMAAWGFTYKTNLVWYKVKIDGGSDRRGRGLLFPQRNRDGAVWRQGAHAHPGPRAQYAERHYQSEARALAQA
jgi:N6-adenosine-specific RNA methylase IME4